MSSQGCRVCALVVRGFLRPVPSQSPECSPPFQSLVVSCPTPTIRCWTGSGVARYLTARHQTPASANPPPSSSTRGEQTVSAGSRETSSTRFSSLAFSGAEKVQVGTGGLRLDLEARSQNRHAVRPVCKFRGSARCFAQ